MAVNAPYFSTTGCTLLNRGQDPEPPGPQAIAEPGRQTYCAELRAPDAERDDPHRPQNSGPVPQGRAPHPRQSSGGRSTVVGYDQIHMDIDNSTRLAYLEVLAVE